MSEKKQVTKSLKSKDAALLKLMEKYRGDGTERNYDMTSKGHLKPFDDFLREGFRGQWFNDTQGENIRAFKLGFEPVTNDEGDIIRYNSDEGSSDQMIFMQTPMENWNKIQEALKDMNKKRSIQAINAMKDPEIEDKGFHKSKN